MHFGKALGTACATFAITNVDDLFVLANFFAEASASKAMTPIKITTGQCLGFTVLLAISLVGFAIATVLPTEPLGFLGLLPILLGIWKALESLIHSHDPDKVTNQSEEPPMSKLAGVRAILKVSSITIINGGDNIGTYIPLFSQAKGAEIAIYVVTYYILLLIWCLVALLTMKQKLILRLAERYADIIVPFLYIGLGIYIVVQSHCYPRAIRRIDAATSTHPGRVAMSVSTVGLLLVCIVVMLSLRLRARCGSGSGVVEATGLAENGADRSEVHSTSCETLAEHGADVGDTLREVGPR